jgi:hypothetical protein
MIPQKRTVAKWLSSSRNLICLCVLISALGAAVGGVVSYEMFKSWKLSSKVIPHDWFDSKKISRGARFSIARKLIRHKAFSSVTRDKVLKVLGAPDGIDDDGPNMVYWLSTAGIFNFDHAILVVKFDQAGRSKRAYIRYD